MLKILALLIGFFIPEVFGCGNVCTYEKSDPEKICYVKALDCLTLECNELMDLPVWIRQSNQTNVTLFENGTPFLPNSYNTSSFRTLNIISVQAVDSGLDNFIAIRDSNSCNFNVFAYDLESWNGSLSVLGQNKLINSTDEFNLEIKTFNDNIQLLYRYEALPMEYLKFNESRLESTECQSTIPWLNCLQADFELDVDRCTKSLSYTFGYGFDSNYSGVVNLMPKNYAHTFSIMYPPQTNTKQKTIVFQDTDTSVDLLCEIDCANPAQNLVYEFTKLDNLNKILLKNDSVDTYKYEIGPNEDVVEIICTVYNLVIADSVHKNESQTRFLLYSKSSTEVLTTETFSTTPFEDNSTNSTYVTSTGNSTNFETTLETTSIRNSTGHPTCPPVVDGLDTWLIIVIAVACFLILVVVLLLIFLVYAMSKRSGSYKKREKLENLPVELDKNIKQKQLNENLESNPVYVMTNSAKNLNQTTPTTRSDPNQTIL